MGPCFGGALCPANPQIPASCRSWRPSQAEKSIHSTAPKAESRGEAMAGSRGRTSKSTAAVLALDALGFPTRPARCATCVSVCVMGWVSIETENTPGPHSQLTPEAPEVDERRLPGPVCRGAPQGSFQHRLVFRLLPQTPRSRPAAGVNQKLSNRICVDHLGSGNSVGSVCVGDHMCLCCLQKYLCVLQTNMP